MQFISKRGTYIYFHFYLMYFAWQCVDRNVNCKKLTLNIKLKKRKMFPSSVLICFLCSILQYIAGRGWVFDGFKTYRTDCKQNVAVDGMFSTSRVDLSCLPQGSNLCPLMLLLSSNDLSRSLEVLNLIISRFSCHILVRIHCIPAFMKSLGLIDSRPMSIKPATW